MKISSAAWALFSKLLVRDQRDWPRQLRLTGFPYHDLRGRPGDPVDLPLGLRRFLEAGPPPLVFSLGSAAFWVAGDFFKQSIEGCGSPRPTCRLAGGRRSLSAAERTHTRRVVVLVVGDRHDEHRPSGTQDLGDRSDPPVVDDDARVREERAVGGIVVSLDANRHGIAGRPTDPGDRGLLREGVIRRRISG